MRILIYSIPPFSDSDFPLIKALRERGHEVWYIIRLAPFMLKTSLLDFGSQDPRNQLLPATEFDALSQWSQYLDLTKTFVSNDTVGKTGLRSFRLFLDECHLVKRINPDAICHIGIPFLFHFFLLLGNRKKSAVVVHDPLPHSGDDGIRVRLKRRFLPLVCKRFILLNKRQADDFCNAYNVAPGRVAVSSLGPYDCYASLRSGRAVDGKYVLFWGRLEKYKGIDYAIKAFTLIRERFPELRLVIAGAGPVCFDSGAVDSDDRIVFIHRYLSNQEVADYASQCQFVVCPYTDATQSGVIQTAFAMGAPVVATDVGNFSDVIVSGYNGIIVPPSDSVALSEAFADLLSNPDKLDAMRSNIADSSREGVSSWTRIADDYIRAFQG
jgi:glycosyltransferase involved in cell wall biosynthesis